MIRTRFAPSPTGFLHIGSVRTALYCWLYARKMGGQFILRIEDTDRERSTQASIDAILAGMEWLDLDYDEGPFYQMQRLDRYQFHLQYLLDNGLAYRCDCSKERLDALREEQMNSKQKPRYDGYCRDRLIDSKNPHVVRFKNPLEGSVVFTDQVYGEIRVDNSELDDLVLIRTDGVPTYNFSVVIDDWEMKITHVIRGDDHINNTPRQINLLHALGAPIPEYAHLPMILGHDGKRLSKRHGAVNVLGYRDEGYLPHALINYLARLGWSHGDQEIFSRDELIQYFGFNHVHRGGATFNQEKLNWLNQHYIKVLPDRVLVDTMMEQFSEGYPYLRREPLEAIVTLMKPRVHTLKDVVEKSNYFFQAPTNFDEEACNTHIKPETIHLLESVCQILAELEEWSSEAISACLKLLVAEQEIKFPALAQPLRLALTGHCDTPSINEVIYLIGQEAVDLRIKAAISHFKKIID